jgi:hypothetical protein
MVVPFYDWHTSLKIAATIQCILDALLPNWQCRIIAFSTNDENTMTGWHSGVATQIDNRANFNLMQIWCAPCQVNLLVKEASHLMHDGSFYKTLHNFSIHLHCQEIFNWKWEAHAQKTHIDGLTLSAFYPGCSIIAAISWYGLLRKILPVPQTINGGRWRLLLNHYLSLSMLHW